jgi:hypothetical protein
MYVNYTYEIIKVKLSFYGHAGAKGERNYSCYSFLTSARYGGEWSASRLGRVLPPEKDLRHALNRRLGGPQTWSRHRRYSKNPLPLPGIELR